MAIARDAFSDGTTSGTTTLTVSHTCTGSDRGLGVAVFFDTDNISSVTYNGVAMTKAGQHDFVSNRIAGYYLKNPASGTHDIVVTCAANNNISLIGFSYTGTNQTTQSLTFIDGGTSTTTPKTTSLTPVADNSWIVLVGRNNTTGNLSASTGVTLFRAANGFHVFDSNGAITPVAAYDMDVTFTGGNSVGTIAFEVMGINSSFTLTETQASADVITTVLGLFFDLAETVTASEAYTNFKVGFSNAAKSVSTWINPDKS